MRRVPGELLIIDGAMGEGGGQVLRSALSLSLLTGQGIEIHRIRAGRSRPGLMPQHLAAVEAAKAVGRADVVGARLGSQQLCFQPRGIFAGDYHFDIGTAGATSLVLQTLALPLQFTSEASTLTINGGTHVPWSPCFHYLDRHWRPLLQAMGYRLSLELRMAGFYPAGGGCISAQVEPHGGLRPVDLSRRGRLREIRGLAAVAGLPLHIAERMQRQVTKRLGKTAVEVVQLPTRSPGAFLMLCARFEQAQACYVSLGKRGKLAERVADESIDQVQAMLDGEAAIDPWLADQLLLPLALVPGRSILRVERISSHLRTLADLVHRFIPVSIELDGDLERQALVVVDGVG
jgi:RNA 3'-terminal phosphate cyclase (ATP)